MFKKIDEILNTEKLNKLLLPALIIYACLVLYGVYIHESWADEAQAWLLARDLGFIDLFKALPAEGHPPLWYLIIFPFAKLGFPYETVKILAALISIAAIYILLLRTKAPVLLKLSIPFGYYVSYQYAIFGRSYCLILFFIAAIISLYPRRFEKPWLFALCVVGLFNSHMLVFSFAFCIMLLFLLDAWQQKKINSNIIASCIFMFIGGIYLLPYLGNSKMAHYFETKTINHEGNIQNALTFGFYVSKLSTQTALAFFESSWINMASTLTVTVFMLTIPRVKVFALLFGAFGGILYIMGYKYSFIQPRHFGVIYIVFAMCYCLMPYYKDDAWNIKSKYPWVQIGTIILIIATLVQIPVTVATYEDDSGNMYSDAKEAAEFIRDNNLENSIVAANTTWSAIAVLPYLPKNVKFFYPACDCFGTYYNYNDCYTREAKFKHQETIKLAYDRNQTQLRKVIYLLNFSLDLKELPFLELAYTNTEEPIYRQEHFYIYKYKEKYIVGDSIAYARRAIKAK
jgi:hypothetical protein